MSSTRTSSRNGSRSRYRNDSLTRRSTRSRSPITHSRSESRYHSRSRSPSRDRSERSRNYGHDRGSSSSHSGVDMNTSTASRKSSGESGSTADDEKKQKMRERLMMWRKRKEQHQKSEATSQRSSRAATPAVQSPQHSYGPVSPALHPESRTSSSGEDSHDMHFMTAATSFATTRSPSVSDAGFESPSVNCTSTPIKADGVSSISRPSRTLGLKPMQRLAHSTGTQHTSRPKMFGKFGLKPQSKFQKKIPSRSVFGSGMFDESEETQSEPKTRLQLVPRSDESNENSPAPTSGSGVESGPAPNSKDEKIQTMDVDEDAGADPLEMYMQSVETQMDGSDNANESVAALADNTEGRAIMDDDGVNYDDGLPADPEDVLAMAAKRLKKKDLAIVDHSKMNYESFRRNFYVEPAELRNMAAEEVEMIRADLGGIKIRGVNCPKPARKWSHFGLPAACAEVIRHQGFEAPTPIQAQAVPAILSGRDVIGVAKTGSGKTLAFVLPMLRHINAQRPLAQGEGPIGLVMTPTRELAVQIHRECRPFLKPLGLRAVCAYGGSAIKSQIDELKRGAEIVVCTPGRLIDLLCANSGRVTNLHRVTYMVLDEADRMFDMGFEPQVTKIVQGVRPSRQTVLFSATFPRQMEALARKILRRPLEIVVGGRALIPPEVAQHVEIVEPNDKFVRLLTVLGETFNTNSETLALIFVDRQESADGLLRDLMRRGYVCNSLHGGKDQTDRDQAISDFKNCVFSVLIATSVAARGLDVRGLNLVINYDCPNHMEDLVHRVGRTGRAGNKGDAYTFITPDQDRYASEVVKAMKLSGLTPPADVQAMADSFLDKVRQGKERHSSKSGFGGKGLEHLDKERNMVKKIQKASYGAANGEGSDDDDDDDSEQVEVDSDGEIVSTKQAKSKTTKAADGEVVRRRADHINASKRSAGAGTLRNDKNEDGSGTSTKTGKSTPDQKSKHGTPDRVLPEGISSEVRAALLAAQEAARRLNVGGSAPSSAGGNAPVSAVDEINKQLGTLAPSSHNESVSGSKGNGRDTPKGERKHGAAAAAAAAAATAANTDSATGSGGAQNSTIPTGEFGCELEINDYPQKARWKATNRETLSRIIDQTGAAITTRGIFVPPGKSAPEGERKLYLSIESDTERSVEQARNEIKRILTEATLHVMEQEARGTTGRYSVV